MDLSKRYGTDKERELSGVWVDLGGGTLVCVARINNKNYNEMLEREMKPQRRILRAGGPDATELLDKILVKVLAHTVLLGWEKVKYKGKKLEYSVDNAIMLMTELPDFRQDIVTIGSEMETYRIEALEEAEKNLKRSSSGNSAGANTTGS